MMKKTAPHLSLSWLIALAVACPLLAAGITGAALAKTPAKPGAPAADAAPVPDSGGPLDAPSPDAISNLRTFKSQGADIHYLGRMYGLDGWLITKDKVVQIVYTTLDGQGTVVGVLYGPNGDMLTSQQLVALQKNGVKLPDTTDTPGMPAAPSGTAPAVFADKGPASERLMKDVENSTYLKFGPDDAPVLYVFMDTRCHFCHGYWDTLSSQFLPQKKLQLRVIPVGILGDDSVQQAERVISAADPAQAWVKIENGDLSVMTITPAADSPQKLQNNNDIMVHWKMAGTPYSVYRGKDGKVKMVYAVPSDVAQVVADIGK